MRPIEVRQVAWPFFVPLGGQALEGIASSRCTNTLQGLNLRIVLFKKSIPIFSAMR
jgi:hypothetical protein